MKVKEVLELSTGKSLVHDELAEQPEHQSPIRVSYAFGVRVVVHGAV